MQYQPWLLGAGSGALLLLTVLSFVTAVAIRERSLNVHACACVLAALTVNSLPLELPHLVPAGLIGIMSMAAMQARGLATHIGSFRPHRRAMSAVAAVLLAIALVDWAMPTRWLLWPAVVLLGSLIALVVARMWPDGRWWATLVLVSQGGFLAASVWVALAPADVVFGLVVPAALVAWGLGIYIAIAWRSRSQGRRRLQEAAARHEDPVTRLATQMVLDQRVLAARALMRRFGHPSSLLLLHVDELERIAQRLGPRAAEAATMEAGLRVQLALSRADVAARIGEYRFAVLAEGSSPQEVAANLAGRILVAGLKRPLQSADGVFLHFRVAVAQLPMDETPTDDLLHALAQHLDRAVRRGADRRIEIVDDPRTTLPAALEAISSGSRSEPPPSSQSGRV